MSVEIVDKYKYLGTVIDNRLNWNSNTTKVYKKANQRLHFLRKLKSFDVNSKVLKLFYQSTIQSVVTFGSIAWFNSLSVKDRNKLERIVKQAKRIIGDETGNLQNLVQNSMASKFNCILDDITHPLNPLIVQNRSGRIRQINLKTRRFQNSFLPTAVRNFNCNFSR